MRTQFDRLECRSAFVLRDAFCRIGRLAMLRLARKAFFGRTMERDAAAGRAVLAGAPFACGKPGFENPRFAARGR